MKGFGIYVQNDLLDPKHHLAMGQAIWLYLWCLDKMTSINEEGVGLVLGGKPIKLEEIQQCIGLGDRTYTRYIRRLEQYGYIETTRTPYGYVIRVNKAKKIFKNRQSGGSESKRTVKVAGENRQSGGNKEDNTVDNTNTIGEVKTSQSKIKKNMSFNRYSEDYLEAEVDIDSGEVKPLVDKKPTKKYPNAPKVRKMFQAVLGKNPANWRVNKNQLQACENLIEERGEEAVLRALKFYSEHRNDDFVPNVSSPYDLDAKWTKLGEFKKRLTTTT